MEYRIFDLPNKLRASFRCVYKATIYLITASPLFKRYKGRRIFFNAKSHNVSESFLRDYDSICDIFLYNFPAQIEHFEDIYLNSR